MPYDNRLTINDNYDQSDDRPFAFQDEETLLRHSGRLFLVDGLLGWNELTIAWGPPKRGAKTAFWLRLARRVSQGFPIFGRSVTGSAMGGPLPALYVALENAPAIRDRVAALRLIDGPAANFRVVTDPVNLSSEADIDKLISYLDSYSVTLMVVDTVARSLGGADENRGADMGRLIANIDRLRAETAAHVVLVHHATKNGSAGPRGHGDLGAAPDTLIEHAELADGSRTATVVDARADPTGLRLRYRMRSVELPQDERVPARTSVVAEELDDTLSGDGRRGGRGRSSYALIALDRLRQAAAAEDGGRVRVDPTWRAAFYDALPAISQDSRKKQFGRVVTDLVADRQIEINDGWVWLRPGQ